jgi:hypothetical protein
MGSFQFASGKMRFRPRKRKLCVLQCVLQIPISRSFSWGLGYWYFRSGFDGFTQSDNYITSMVYYRLNDNCGFRARHDFNAADGRTLLTHKFAFGVPD